MITQLKPKSQTEQAPDTKSTRIHWVGGLQSRRVSVSRSKIEDYGGLSSNYFRHASAVTASPLAAPFTRHSYC